MHLKYDLTNCSKPFQPKIEENTNNFQGETLVLFSSWIPKRLNFGSKKKKNHKKHKNQKSESTNRPDLQRDKFLIFKYDFYFLSLKQKYKENKKNIRG